MHDYKDYLMTYSNGKTEIYSCCCKCGTVEVINQSDKDLVCSGKMHANCTVKMCNMKLIKTNKTI